MRNAATVENRFFRRPLFLLSLVLGCSVLSFAVYRSREPRPALQFDTRGLSSLSVRGTELLSFGDMRVTRVLMADQTGRRFPAKLDSSTEVDAKAKKVTRHFPWGEVSAQYS